MVILDLACKLTRGGKALGHTALGLINELIGCWSKSTWNSRHEEYYLTVLLPSIMCSDGSVHATDKEKKTVATLRHLLSEAEWQQLPTLNVQRRANNLNDLASDRERAEAQRESKRREDEAVPEEGFSFETLLVQPWVHHGIKVEVYDESGKLRNRR